MTTKNEKVDTVKDVDEGAAKKTPQAPKVKTKTSKTMEDVRGAMQRIEALEVVKASIISGETAMYTKRNPKIYSGKYIKAYIPEGLNDVITKFTIEQIDERILKLQRFITGE